MLTLLTLKRGLALINIKLPLIGLLSENTNLQLPLHLPEIDMNNPSKVSTSTKLDLGMITPSQLAIGKLGICNMGTDLKSLKSERS